MTTARIAPASRAAALLLLVGLLAAHTWACNTSNSSFTPARNNAANTNNGTSTNSGTTSTNNGATSTNSGTTTVSPSSTCDIYCDAMLQACATVFADVNACNAACASYPDTGSIGSVTGDNLQCRLSYAKTALVNGDDATCASASPSGGTSCIGDTTCSGVACEQGDRCNPSTGQCEAFVCTPDSFEPNDTIETPADLTPGETIDATVCGADEDLYRFVVTEDGSDVYAAIDFQQQTGDLELAIGTAAGDNIDDSRSVSDNEYISAFNLPAGEYLINVFTSVNPPASNAYRLSVLVNPPFELCDPIRKPCDDPSTSCVNEICVGTPCTENSDCGAGDFTCNTVSGFCQACTDDIFEPNDTQDTATDITNNLTPSETLNTCRGSDNYAVNLEAGQTVSVTIFFAQRDGDLDLVLKRPDGRTGTRSGLAQDNESMSYTAETSGRHIIQVFGHLNAFNTYTMNVSIN